MQMTYDRWRRPAAAIVLLLSCTIVPLQTARGELCRMIGCSNQLFYIFLPDANLTPGANATFNMTGQGCKAPEESQTFERKGLPAVNEVATLKAEGRWVYTEEQIEEEIDSFQPPGFDSASAGNCAISWEAPDGSGSLDMGMKLQILGYRTFVGHSKVEFRKIGKDLQQTTSYPEQLLFAMVVVE